MAKTRKKSVLGGHVYVVEEVGLNEHVVHKLPHDPSGEAEIYEIDKDGVCSCKAGDFGTDCKHVAMVDGSLEGREMGKRRAEVRLEEHLDKIRDDWPRARIVSLLDYVTDRRVRRGAALACGVQTEHSAEKLVLWGEFKGLLIRIHCFKDPERYRRALRRIREKTYEKPDYNIGPVGKTYGGDHESG